jgi:hypothetical protein
VGDFGAGAVCPGRALAVDGVVGEATVQDADEAVVESSQCLVVVSPSRRVTWVFISVITAADALTEAPIAAAISSDGARCGVRRYSVDRGGALGDAALPATAAKRRSDLGLRQRRARGWRRCC